MSSSPFDLHLHQPGLVGGRQPALGEAGDQRLPVGAHVDGEEPGALEEGAGGARTRRGGRRRASRRGRTPAARRRAGGWPAARRCRGRRGGPRGSSISSRPIGSRPAVGSSSSTSSGSATIAWASFVRWRMPVEKPADGSEAGLVQPHEVEHVRGALAGGPGREPAQLPEGGRRCRPRSGRAGGSRARACTRAGCARRSDRAATSTPHTSRLPSVGWLSPSIIRKRVVLPAPLAPTSPTRPAGTSRSRPSTAVTPGYRLVSPRVRRRAGEGSTGPVCQADDVAFVTTRL